MISLERLPSSHRALLIFVLLCVLVGLFVWYGTVEPDSNDNNYPGSSQIAEFPDSYIDQKVSVGGIVVSHDPLRIETGSKLEETVIFEIQNVEDPPPIGHTMSVFGTLNEANVIHAENTITREPWEAIYMYVISFIGGLWVLGRLLVHWRPDRDTLSVLPRGDSDA